jgi:hypothetical protein
VFGNPDSCVPLPDCVGNRICLLGWRLAPSFEIRDNLEREPIAGQRSEHLPGQGSGVCQRAANNGDYLSDDFGINPISITHRFSEAV